MFDRFLNVFLHDTLASNLLALRFLLEFGSFAKDDMGLCVLRKFVSCFSEDQTLIKIIFRTQPMIFDGAFFAVIVNGY